MGLSFRVTSDFSGLKGLLEDVGGNACGREAAAAARDAMDVHMRKDTGNLAGAVTVEPWHVRYWAEYAAAVWDVPPQIVSPRNKSARAKPDQQPNVAEDVADAISLYIKKRTR